MNSTRKRGGCKAKSVKSVQPVKSSQSSIEDILSACPGSSQEHSSPKPSNIVDEEVQDSPLKNPKNKNASPTTYSADPECSSSQNIDEESPDAKKRRTKLCGNKKSFNKQEIQILKSKQAAYTARLKELDLQTKQVKEEQAVEYKQRLAGLEEKMNETVQIGEKLREFQCQELETLRESEHVAAKQDLEEKIHLLQQTLQDEVQQKIKKLRNDKHQADVDFELWQQEERFNNCDSNDVSSSDNEESSFTTNPVVVKNSNRKKSFKKDLEEKRRKPISVQPPFILLGLSEEEILHDFRILQRAALEADLRRNNA